MLSPTTYDEILGGRTPEEEATAKQNEAARLRSLRPDDFWCYLEMESAFIFIPTGKIWPGTSVDKCVPPVANGKEAVKASAWIASHRHVEQMTWAPGLPELIEQKVMADGGWIDHPSCNCFNLYRPPTIKKTGNALNADRWLDHIAKVFPEDVDHIVCWLAFKVQHPDKKINHALVFGGEQGIGKDTILEPVKYAVGSWNFQEISPVAAIGRFTGFLQSVILRVSEARDLGECNRYQFYDHLKSVIAAPPDVLRVDEKHVKERYIPNVVGVIITTNYKANGIYLPPDDRRHYIAWSSLTRDDFTADYWQNLYDYYEGGGYEDVTAFLREYDLSKFDPKAPPKKTAAFWDIVRANSAPEDMEMADVIDRIGNPTVVTLSRIQDQADPEFALWMKEHRNRSKIPHRMESCGYTPVINPDAKDGYWKIKDKRQAVYGLNTIDRPTLTKAAERLCTTGTTAY